MTKACKIALIISLLGNLSVAYVGYKAIQYRQFLNYWLEKYTLVVSEFSGRDVYAEDNDRLRSETPAKQRIVFLGTQVTGNWDLARDFSDYEAINRGVDSQRVAGFLLRFRPDVIELAPVAVVVEVSSYNFRPQWSGKELCDYMSSIFDLSTANEIIPIFTTVIDPVGGAPDYGGYRTADSIAAFNNWLRTKNKKEGWVVVAFDSLLVGPDGSLDNYFANSLVQPNQAGYEIMASGIKGALKGLEQ